MPLHELRFGLTFERKAVRCLRDFVGGFKELRTSMKSYPCFALRVLRDQAIEIIGEAHGVPPRGERTMMAPTIPSVRCAGSMPIGWLGSNPLSTRMRPAGRFQTPEPVSCSHPLGTIS